MSAASLRMRGGWVSWLTMAMGLMIFMCGIALLGLSQFAQRIELWDMGWPLALGGQSLLLVGIVLRVEALWQAYRQTVLVLKTMELNPTSVQPMPAPISPAPGTSRALHVHYVEQTNPQRVLADLRGQLDLLALSLSPHEQTIRASHLS